MEGSQGQIINDRSPIYGSIHSKEPSISEEVSSPVIKLEEKENNFGFGLRFIKRFYFLHKKLFKSFISPATFFFLFLLGQVVGREFLVYEVGLIPGGYYLPLGDKDLDGFWKQTQKAVGLIVAISLVNSIVTFTRKILSVFFRKLLCDASHDAYFTDIKYYQLNVLDKEIDNPDQRMTQDIEKFCSTYCQVLPNLLVAPFVIGWYVRKGYEKSGWQGPVGCFGLFVIATIANKLIMGPVVNYVCKQYKREGDFRFMHMLVRVNSESIAFQQAAPLEKGKVEDSLAKLLSTQRSLYFRQFFLDLSTHLCDYIGSIFSYIMLAIPIFSGKHDDLTPAELSMLISENAFILIYLIYSFTRVVDLSAQFPEIAGATHRISQLLERLASLDDSSKKDEDTFSDNLTKWAEVKRKLEHKLNLTIGHQDHFKLEEANGDTGNLLIWSLDNVTFSRPMSDKSLVSNLTINFVVGENLLITGPSSAGKTSIFRLLRGLWPKSKGNVKHFYPPGPTGVWFSPQKCYLSVGTLREQISFPLLPDKSERTNKLIDYYVDKLKLSPLVSRVGGLDVNCSWTQIDSCSPGEVQRLCLLRVLYHQPVVAVLDEITSALPHQMEDYVYSEMKRLGITIISVGHRDSIRKYHDKQLIITGNGEWELSPINLKT